MGWTVHLVSKRKVRNLYDFPEEQKDSDHLEVLGVGGDNIKIYSERLESSLSGTVLGHKSHHINLSESSHDAEQKSQSTQVVSALRQ